MAWSNNLFYVAFLSQIFLMSYYFPNKLLARMRHVLTTYPPAAYPKLYPKPIEQYERRELGLVNQSPGLTWAYRHGTCGLKLVACNSAIGTIADGSSVTVLSVPSPMGRGQGRGGRRKAMLFHR